MAGPDPQTGLDKLKGSLGALAEPALIFAATGSKAAAIWGGLKAVIIGNVLGPLSLVTGALIGITGAMKLFLGRIELVGKGIDKLRSLEQIKTQFDPLLGGAALAQKRLEELYSFASSTPFQLEGIAEANRTLQVLTKGALATVEGMKLVGDAAAVTGQSMQTISFWVGRLYDGLKSGAPIGEASSRLQEMGLITGDVRRKLEASRKAGDSFTDTFEILEKELKKSEGGMEKMSQTLGGLESTLSDVKGKIAGEFAQNFMEAEKTSTAAFINALLILEPVVARLGEVFSVGATMVAKFFGVITGTDSETNKMSESFKSLGNDLKNALDIFLVFGAAVAANQFATIVGSLARGSSAALAFTTSIHKTALAQMYSNHASKGLKTALLLTGKEFLGLSIKAKLASGAQLLFAGASKVAGFAIGMFTSAIKAAFAALVANPIAVVITAVVGLVAAILRFNGNAEDTAKRIKDLKEEFGELTKQLDETVNSIKSFEDSLSAVDKVSGSIDSITDRIKELASEVDASSGGLTGGFFAALGDNDEQIAAIDQLISQYDMLQEKLQDIASIDTQSLELGKMKQKELQTELEIRKEIEKIAIDTAKVNASDAEKIAILARQQATNSSNLEVSKQALSSQVAKEEFERSDDRRGKRSDIEQIKLERAKIQAQIAKEKAMAEDRDAKGFTQSVVGDASFAESINPMKVYEERKAELELLSAKLGTDIVDMEAQLEKDLTKSTGVDKVTKGLIDSIDLGNSNTMIFPDDMFPLGTLTAFQQKLKDTTMDGATAEKVNQIIVALQAAANETGELTAEQEKLNAEFEEMQRVQQRAIELFQLEQRLHQENLDINTQGFQVAKKKNEVELEGLKERLSIIQKLGDEQKSIDDMEKRAKEVKGQIGKTDDEDEKAKLEKELKVLEEQIRKAREMNEEVTKINNQIENLEKKIEDAAAQLAESVRKIFADIAAELRGLEIDEAFLNMDFGEAFKKIQADNEANEKETQRRRVDELRKAGKTEEDAKRIASEEAANREKAKENARQGTRNFSDRDNIKARLEMESKVFGDAESRKKLRAMNDQDFFRGKLEENLRAGFGDLEATQFARQDLDSKLMRETPEMKVVADSFRRIGAGGQGVATDPMKILAERRLRVQELIQKDINKMANAILQEQDKEAVLR